MAIAEHIERATRLIAAADYREAVRTCRRALLAHPESIKLRLLLGRGLLAMERFEEVRTEMLAVLRSSPKEVGAYQFLGEAYLYDGRPDRAIEAFHQALEIEPNNEEIRSLLDDAAFEEPTATSEGIVPGIAEITRESLLPGFDEEETGSTQRALPAAVFRERVRAAPRGTQSYSMPPRSMPPRSLPSPAKLPTGLGVPEVDIEEAETTEAPFSAGGKKQRSAIRSRTSAPPPLPSKPASKASLSKVSSTIPPPAPMRGATPEKPVFQKTLLGSSGSSGSAKPSRPAVSLQGFDTESGEGEDTWNTADALLSGELDAMEKGLLDRPDSSDFEDLPTEVQVPTMFRPAPDASASPGRPSWSAGEPRLAFADPRPPSGVPGALPLASESTVAEDLDDDAYGEDEDTRERDPLWKSPSAAVPPPSVPPPVEGRQRVRRAKKTSSNTRRWVLRGLALVLLFGIGFGAAAFFRLHKRGEALTEATAVVTRHGGADNYERAMTLAHKEDASLLHARLAAARAFEYGGGDPAAIRKQVATLDQTKADYALALAYLSLRDQQPEEALRLLEAHATDAEAQYVSSLALLEVGKWEEARKSARSAAQILPGAARYEAQRIVSESVTGVEGTPPPEANEHTTLQVASMIHKYMVGDGVDAARAQALLKQELTIANQVWMRWLLLRAAIDAEQVEPARKMANAFSSERAMQAVAHAPSPLRLLLASAMLDMRETKKAEAFFATLGPGVRSRPEALASQVHALLTSNRVEDARALLSRSKDKSPATDLLRARVELAEGKHEAALEVLAGALQGKRTRTDAMRLSAQAYQALGRWGEAIRMIEPLWKLNKSSTPATRALVASLFSAERQDDAMKVIAEFEQAGGDPSVTAVFRARMALEAGDLASAKKIASKLDTSTPEAAALKAQVLRRTGDLHGADKVLAAALNADPSHQGLLQEQTLLSLRLYRFDEAQRAAKLLDVGNSRSRSLAAMVDVTQAGGLSALERMESLDDSKDADLHVYRAYALYHGEKDTDARRAFDHVLSLRPGHPEGLIGAGLVALRTGGLAKAGTSADEALQVADEVGDRFRARALALQAKLNYERGGFKQAQDLVAQALKADSDCALAHLVAASLDEERGKNAMAEFKKATEGNFVMPEALARFALASSKPACDMAKRYLEAAPKGFDAPDMRRIEGRCK